MKTENTNENGPVDLVSRRRSGICWTGRVLLATFFFGAVCCEEPQDDGRSCVQSTQFTEADLVSCLLLLPNLTLLVLNFPGSLSVAERLRRGVHRDDGGVGKRSCAS